MATSGQYFVVSNFDPVPSELQGGFLAVGNFEGVHCGHARLISRLRTWADASGGRPAIALTFDPSPASILRPGSAPAPLTWLDRKVELLHAAGATHVGVFQTGRWLLSLSAKEFLDRVVRGQFQAHGMVEGPSFGFGRDRGGDARLLAQWCQDSGLLFEIIPPDDYNGLIVSSSRIRNLLAEGKVADAATLLGRPHRVRGKVRPGAGRGLEIGIPTANLAEVQGALPGDGVYAGHAWMDLSGPAWTAAIHIGPNLTFGESTPSFEVHLLDYNAGPLYNHTLEVEFFERVRGSIKFQNSDELVQQIQRDVAETRKLIGVDFSAKG